MPPFFPFLFLTIFFRHCASGDGHKSWSIMTPICRVPGCGAEAASRYSHYCRNHRARLRRHGAVDQEGVTATDLAPYLAKVRARIEKNRESSAWGQLQGRWLAVVDHARSVVAFFNNGKPGSSFERKAAHEVLKIADAAKPHEVVEVVLAMFIMQEQEPRRFRSDAAFRVQLVRRTRALADVNAGLSYDHKSGKVRRVYRELSPKVIAIIGQWLAVALGGAGVHLAQLEQKEEEGQRKEHLELHKALEELK